MKIITTKIISPWTFLNTKYHILGKHEYWRSTVHAEWLETADVHQYDPSLIERVIERVNAIGVERAITLIPGPAYRKLGLVITEHIYGTKLQRWQIYSAFHQFWQIINSIMVVKGHDADWSQDIKSRDDWVTSNFHRSLNDLRLNKSIVNTTDFDVLEY